MSSSLKRYSLVASAAAMLTGFLALAGWWLDISVLKGVFPGLATMKANTAISFLLAGVSLYLLLTGWMGRRGRVIALACAGAVTVIALLTLGQYMLDREMGIDQLLFEDVSTPSASHPGRMSPVTAAGFFCLCLALLMLDIRRALGFVQGLMLAVFLISLIALVGYIYDVEFLYRVAPFSSMALHTVIGFILLSTAVLCARPDRGFMKIIAGSDAGGIMARRLLPAVIALPLAIGWINLLAAQRGIYSHELRIAVVTVTSIIVFGTLIWLNARSLFQMEAERRQAEKKFEELLESAPDAMVIVNEEGEIVLVNSQTEKLFGYRRENILGRKVEMLVPEQYRGIHKKHRAEYFTQPQARSMGQERDLYGRREDGSQFPISVSLSPLVTKEGTLVTAAIRDVTDRKRAEEALAEQSDELTRQAAELARSNAELSQFAYVASHDLQEPLRAIAGCVQLLQHRFEGELDSRTQELISHTVDGATRMQSLINDLLTLSRVGARGEPFKSIDSSIPLERALANLRASIAESSAVVTHGPLPEVNADPTQLTQLFQNLVGNAMKFRSDEALPIVHISAEQQERHGDTETVDSTTSRGHGDSFTSSPRPPVTASLPHGEWVFSVRDNGIGIEPEYSERIFGVFQRLHTRKEYPGTGIGLAICKKIVERHGGRIWVESEPGKGATFYFTLPDLNRGRDSGGRMKGEG
ncbi:MAG: PAS domain S-box protein [Blastocatellia bacterium]|nr:PAS domain S-box protein [Blastocatellia bacterium]